MKISKIPQAYPVTSYSDLNPASGSTSPSQEVKAPHDESATVGATQEGTGKQALTEEETQKVEELKARDREVRAHEQAHYAAAGQYAVGAPKFEYETGPDGRRYAVGGEVQMDTSEIPDNPQATMRKMQQIRRAALAPSDPSAQDRRMASEASWKEAQARQELTEENRTEAQSHDDAPLSSQATAAGHQSGSTKQLQRDPLIDVVV